jgi:protease I
MVKVVPLPVPSEAGSMTVEAALSKIQGPAPAVSDLSLKPSEISQLAWAAQGRPISSSAPMVSPDERALLKVYFVMPDGFYLYLPIEHALQQVRGNDLRAQVAAQLLKQQNAPIGGCQIVVGGSTRDFTTRYGNRARNVMLLLAGQMIQNMQLQAAALNLTFIGINGIDLTAVRNTFAFGRDAEPLYVLIVGYPNVAMTPAAANAAAAQPTPAGSPKKVVIVAPQNGFEDVELFDAKRLLEMNSVQVVIASLRAGPIRSMTGNAIQADLAISDIHPADFGAIVFVGGTGTEGLFNTQPLRDLVQQAAAQRKIMAASGNAPGILAAAGVLRGARVTGIVGIQSQLMQAGAAYTGTLAEKDGPVITSAGAQAVPIFVQAILDGLNGM